jgi:hypothetical protein
MRAVSQFLLMPLLVFGTVDATAQAARASQPTDTLRYRESTVRRFSRDAEYGLVVFHFAHNALIAFAVARHDTASAWYEQLTLGFVSGMGVVRHDTQGHLLRPFTLGIDSIGNVRTLAVPTFPAVEPPVDLTSQFRDFFPSLPAAALAVGLEWSDTIQFADTSVERRVRSRRGGPWHVTPLGEAARPLRCVAREPRVAGLPAHAVAGTQQGHVVVTALVVDHELQPLSYRTGLLPGHRLPRGCAEALTLVCYPSSRNILLPINPVYTHPSPNEASPLVRLLGSGNLVHDALHHLAMLGGHAYCFCAMIRTSRPCSDRDERIEPPDRRTEIRPTGRGVRVDTPSLAGRQSLVLVPVPSCDPPARMRSERATRGPPIIAPRAPA